MLRRELLHRNVSEVRRDVLADDLFVAGKGPWTKPRFRAILEPRTEELLKGLPCRRREDSLLLRLNNRPQLGRNFRSRLPIHPSPGALTVTITDTQAGGPTTIGTLVNVPLPCPRLRVSFGSPDSGGNLDLGTDSLLRSQTYSRWWSRVPRRALNASQCARLAHVGEQYFCFPTFRTME